MEDDLRWKTTYGGGQPEVEDDLQWKTTFAGSLHAAYSALRHFLSDKSKFKYIDDWSILEVINLIMAGISSYNDRQQVQSDMQIGHKFIHTANIQTKWYLKKISEWKRNEMKLQEKQLYDIQF